MSKHLLEANDENFDAVVLGSSIPVLFDVWASWCGPCRQLTPLLDKLAQEAEGQLVIVKINCDDSPQTAERFGVESIPFIRFAANGEVLEDEVSSDYPELRAFLQSKGIALKNSSAEAAYQAAVLAAEEAYEEAVTPAYEILEAAASPPQQIYAAAVEAAKNKLAAQEISQTDFELEEKTANDALRAAIAPHKKVYMDVALPAEVAMIQACEDAAKKFFAAA